MQNCLDGKLSLVGQKPLVPCDMEDVFTVTLTLGMRELVKIHIGELYKEDSIHRNARELPCVTIASQDMKSIDSATASYAIFKLVATE